MAKKDDKDKGNPTGSAAGKATKPDEVQASSEEAQAGSGDTALDVRPPEMPTAEELAETITADQLAAAHAIIAAAQPRVIGHVEPGEIAGYVVDPFSKSGKKMPFVYMWLTKTRYLMQAGEIAPKTVPAAPNAAVRVKMPATLLRKTKHRMANGKWSEPKWVEEKFPEDAFLQYGDPVPIMDTRPGLKTAAQQVPLAAMRP